MDRHASIDTPTQPKCDIECVSITDILSIHASSHILLLCINDAIGYWCFCLCLFMSVSYALRLTLLIISLCGGHAFMEVSNEHIKITKLFIKIKLLWNAFGFWMELCSTII